MRVEEAIQEIQSEHKWWATSGEKCDHDWNKNTAIRILEGTAKQVTIKKFLNKFGYEIETHIRKITDVRKGANKG